jgi:hypothetical protein
VNYSISQHEKYRAGLKGFSSGHPSAVIVSVIDGGDKPSAEEAEEYSDKYTA